MSTTKTSTHDLLERLFAAFNRHDADAVMSRMTVDVVFDAAVGPDAFGRRFVGRESVRDAFIQVWRNFPDVAWNCTRHTVAGDVGLSEWIFRATRPDGGRIDADGCDIFEIEASLIKRKTAFRKDRPVQY
jgi:ketosteroid isomerase-like protein